MTPHSVYWIRCTDHTDIMSQGYIGVSKDAKRRFTEHSKSKQNRHLRFAGEKYGWDNLIKSEILISTEEYCLDIERKLRPTDGIGWNCTTGGGKPPPAYGNKYMLGRPSWAKGKKLSLETRKKISDAVRLQMQDPARREINRQTLLGKPSLRKGKTHTPESIEKMRLVHTGVPSKKKGIPANPESVAKMIATVRANPWTCPHCNKVGFNNGTGTRWHFDNCKEKVL